MCPFASSPRRRNARSSKLPSNITKVTWLPRPVHSTSNEATFTRSAKPSGCAEEREKTRTAARATPTIRQGRGRRWDAPSRTISFIVGQSDLKVRRSTPAGYQGAERLARHQGGRDDALGQREGKSQRRRAARFDGNLLTVQRVLHRATGNGVAAVRPNLDDEPGDDRRFAGTLGERLL